MALPTYNSIDFVPVVHPHPNLHRMCIHCLRHSKNGSFVSVDEWVKSKAPYWPLPAVLNIVHHGTCRQRFYDSINTGRLPCFWETMFQAIYIIVNCFVRRSKPFWVNFRRHVDKLDAATSSFPAACDNPTHLFCASGFERSQSAVIHSWYLFIDRCIKNGVPKALDDISAEDKAFGSPLVFALAIRHDRFTCVKPWYACMQHHHYHFLLPLIIIIMIDSHCCVSM
jgi:hypothetical protein